MKKSITASFLSILFLLPVYAFSAPTAIAQVPVSPPKLGDKPVEVRIGVYVEEILEIDEGSNTYQAKGYLELNWYDARLKFAAGPDPRRKIYLEHGAELMLDKIWWPDLEFVNEVKSRQRFNEELLISPNGHLNYRERFSVQLASNFEMQQFPFDTQHLLMDIESFAWSSEEMVLKTNQNVVGFSNEFKLPGWTVQSVEEIVREHKEPRDRARFSEMEAAITIRRDPGYFLWKFLVPLTVVMILLSGVLWIPPCDIHERVSATLTGILTAAAYGFVVSPYLPNHVYNTYLDEVVMIALCYSSALMVLNVVNYQLHMSKSTALALRIDRICQVLFPVAFLALVLLAYRF